MSLFDTERVEVLKDLRCAMALVPLLEWSGFNAI